MIFSYFGGSNNIFSDCTIGKNNISEPKIQNNLWWLKLLLFRYYFFGQYLYVENKPEINAKNYEKREILQLKLSRILVNQY